jgi:phosphoglycolate phosphatase-like HAD superfamily hydrolase
MAMPKQNISVLITDLDNTLFDWVDIWHCSFKAMLERLVADSGMSADDLLRDFKTVFQRYDTSEYAFAIEELPSLIAKHPGEDLTKLYSSAIDAYRSARRAALARYPYPRVMETLEEIKDRGTLIVGYTESMEFYSNYRLRKFGLDRVLDFLYSPKDHDLPPGRSSDEIRFHPQDKYLLRRTINRYTPKNERKPSARVLLDIMKGVGADRGTTIYVGDSLMKDVQMAQEAGVIDVWAKYGVASDRPEYNLLRRVTHWSESTVEKERQTTNTQVQPTHILENFADLLNIFDFASFIDVSDQRFSFVVDVWKKTIDVQQHFNDLELRIRNYAITVLAAILGVVAFALKENLSIRLYGWTVSVGGALIMAALVGWVAFYFMDRWWYHMLLYGAVMHARSIETRYGKFAPELLLTKAIGDASPIQIKKFRIHSARKIDLFYGAVAALLIVFGVASSNLDVDVN